MENYSLIPNKTVLTTLKTPFLDEVEQARMDNLEGNQAVKFHRALPHRCPNKFGNWETHVEYSVTCSQRYNLGCTS